MNIVLDPGHGGEDPGCQANGLVEKDMALALALQIQELGRASDITFNLTRTDDETISLSERGKRARALDAEQMIVCHFDTNANPTVGALTCYLRDGDAQSRNLANILMRLSPPILGPARTIAVESRGWKRRAYNVVRTYENVPTLLVECAFLSKHSHARWLQNQVGRCALATAIFTSIVESTAKLDRSCAVLNQSRRKSESDECINLTCI
jgi:N-acetylmuramoyl-L-alanine amidase